MSISDFWNCSLWEFSAAIEGWNKANSSDDEVGPMSHDRYDEFLKEKGYI